MTTYHVRLQGKEVTVSLGDDGAVLVQGSGIEYRVRRLSKTEFSVLCGGRQMKVVAIAGRGDVKEFDVISGGFSGVVNVESERERLLRKHVRSTTSASAKREVHAPMPAMVVRLEVSVGDEVRSGQPLIALEAMKMENEILSPCSGYVKAIYVKVGKPVEKGELLLLLE